MADVIHGWPSNNFAETKVMEGGAEEEEEITGA